MLSSISLGATAASYDVIELPTQTLASNQFANSIDNTGLMLLTLTRPYNPPIDLSLLDITLFPLTDPDAAAQGDFNLTDYTLLASFVYTESARTTTPINTVSQKLATNVAFQTDGTDTSFVSGFDSFSEELSSFSFASETQIGKSVNGTHIVGAMEGPFSTLEYINEDGEGVTYNINSFSSRGFVQVGDNVTELLPENTDAGGYSRAYSINEGLMVAGVSSIGFSDAINNVIANCVDDEVRGDEPVEVCLYRFRKASGSNIISSAQRRAVVWQVDANGEVLDKTVYGLAFEPEADATNLFASTATDINDAGVAVGSSSVPISTTFTDAAVAFENGEVIRLIEDDDSLPNIATGINNNNIVIGYRGERINGVTRTKMFVFNRNSGEVSYPDGFFVSSSNIPRAMNNNNLVVGEAEIDSDTGTRRRNGFLYDIDNDTFTNLNDLLPCDSPYSIIGANDINDNNEILAEALLPVPARSLDGEIFLNDSGEQTLIDSVVAVKLDPTGQEPSDCDLSEEEQTQQERQGAGVSLVSIFGLFVLSFLRIRRSKK